MLKQISNYYNQLKPTIHKIDPLLYNTKTSLLKIYLSFNINSQKLSPNKNLNQL